MAGPAERRGRGETVENIVLDLLAVVTGGAAAFLVTASRAAAAPKLTIFVAFGLRDAGGRP